MLMKNKFKAQSLNRKSYRKFTLSWFSVTCFKHVGLLWPISALDRKQVCSYRYSGFRRYKLANTSLCPRVFYDPIVCPGQIGLCHDRRHQPETNWNVVYVSSRRIDEVTKLLLLALNNVPIASSLYCSEGKRVWTKPWRKYSREINIMTADGVCSVVSYQM